MAGKVLIASEPLMEPFNRASKKLLRDFVRVYKGPTVHVFTDQRSNLELSPSVESHPLFTTPDYGPVNKMRLGLRLLRLLDKRSILHTLFSPAKLTSTASSFIKNMKGCKWIQSLPSALTVSGEFIRNSTIINGDIIIVFSKYAEQKVKLLCPKKNVRRITPGINLAEMKLVPSKEKLKGTLGFQDSYLICFPGNYHSSGAMPVLRTIINELKGPLQGGALISFCRFRNKKDINYEEELHELALSKGVESKVILLRTIANPLQIMKASDVIIFPFTNLYGKFDYPLVLMEAMALEKLIIINDIPPLKELVEDGAGVPVRENNPKSWIEYLIGFHNKKQRLEIEKTARQVAHSKFDVHRMAEEIGKIYTETLL
jgi:glycosyltransferase involved in cell wall biosynthesis